MNKTILEKEYYKTPNGLFDVVKNTQEFAVLSYLLRLKNGTDTPPYAGYGTIASACKMGKSTVQKTIKALEDCKFVSHKSRRISATRFDSNEYTIHLDVIEHAIKTMNRNYYKDSIRDRMAVQRIIKNPQLLEKVAQGIADKG